MLKFNTVNSLQKPEHVIYIDQKRQRIPLVARSKETVKQGDKFCKTPFWKLMQITMKFKSYM